MKQGVGNLPGLLGTMNQPIGESEHVLAWTSLFLEGGKNMAKCGDILGGPSQLL